MKNATELLTAYLAQIEDPAAAAALFADDGVIELPWVNARAQGPAEIEKFLAGLLAKVPDFQFQNIRTSIQRPTRPSASTTWRLLCRRPARAIDRPTPDASSLSKERSNCCEKRSIAGRHYWHAARIEGFCAKSKDEEDTMSNKLEGKTPSLPAAPAHRFAMASDLWRKALMFSLPAAARKNWMRPLQKWAQRDRHSGRHRQPGRP